jgi:hypothetical protein
MSFSVPSASSISATSAFSLVYPIKAERPEGIISLPAVVLLSSVPTSIAC